MSIKIKRKKENAKPLSDGGLVFRIHTIHMETPTAPGQEDKPAFKAGEIPDKPFTRKDV